MCVCVRACVRACVSVSVCLLYVRVGGGGGSVVCLIQAAACHIRAAANRSRHLHPLRRLVHSSGKGN